MYFLTKNFDSFTQTLLTLEFGSANPQPGLHYFEPFCLLNKTNYYEKRIGEKFLVLNSNTGAWCFLSPQENSILQRINGITSKTLQEYFPMIDIKTLEEFLFYLYIRNIITINNQTFIDETLFNDTPLKKLDPLFIVEPTKRCNLRCTYCFAKCNSESQPVMNEKSALRIIELILDSDFNNITIEFSGGEALLEFDFIQYFVNELKKKLASSDRPDREVLLTMQTNATLLDENKLDFLLENDISFGFSLDGGENENNFTRKYPNGKGTYNDIAKAIKLTHSKGRGIGIISVLTKNNCKNHIQSLNSYKELGLLSIKLNPIFPGGRAEENWNELAISDSEILAVQQQYLDYFVAESEPVMEGNVLQMFENVSTCMRNYRCMLSCCGAGENMFTFAPNGNIYLCARYQDKEEYCIGHIDDPDIRMQNLYQDNALITALRSRKVANIEKCKKCVYRRFCEGNCSLASYEAFGDWRHSHPNCDYYHGTYDQIFDYLSRYEDLPKKLDEDLIIFNRSFDQ